MGLPTNKWSKRHFHDGQRVAFRDEDGLYENGVIRFYGNGERIELCETDKELYGYTLDFDDTDDKNIRIERVYSVAGAYYRQAPDGPWCSEDQRKHLKYGGYVPSTAHDAATSTTVSNYRIYQWANLATAMSYSPLGKIESAEPKKLSRTISRLYRKK